MSIEFAVGKRVVCIRGDWVRLTGGERAPMKGGIYTIRTIEAGKEHEGFVFLRFNELVNPAINYGYAIAEASFNSRGFRPVRATSIDCFTKLLEKQPELVGGNA